MSNVVVLMSDEHNPFYSSVYGHPFVATPNMDRLAAMGTVFENAYCPSPLCLPSRCAFMAGRRAHQIGAYSNCNLHLSAFPTYGEVLSGQGVYTAYVGKTDCYRPGNQLGFDEMILPADRAAPGDTSHGRTPLAIREGAAERAQGYGAQPNPFDGDLQRVDAALEWLEERAPTLDKPWVLMVNLNKPHFPHRVTPPLWEAYARGADLPRYGVECQSARHPYARDLRAHFETDQFSQEQIRNLRRGYLGCVAFVDEQLGRILDAVKVGGAEDTVVIYTSDHGEMLGKFGLWWKCALYEDSVRVPVLAAGPGFTANGWVKTPVDLLDVQASLFASLGVRRPGDWTGIPLQEVPVDDAERVVFSEYHGHGTRSGAYMVRKGDWKLIYCMEAPHLLFNVAEDPDELDNRFDHRLQKALELEGELRRICGPENENLKAHAFEREQLDKIRVPSVG